MYGVSHCPHNWSKGGAKLRDGGVEGRMLVQQRMRLVVGMSSVTKRGARVKYKPITNECSVRYVETQEIQDKIKLWMGDKILGGYLIQPYRLRIITTPNLSSENFTRYKEAKHDLERPTHRTVHIRVNANIYTSNFTHTATHAYSHRANMTFNLPKEQFTVEKSPQKKIILYH